MWVALFAALLCFTAAREDGQTHRQAVQEGPAGQLPDHRRHIKQDISNDPKDDEGDGEGAEVALEEVEDERNKKEGGPTAYLRAAGRDREEAGERDEGQKKMNGEGMSEDLKKEGQEINEEEEGDKGEESKEIEEEEAAKEVGEEEHENKDDEEEGEELSGATVAETKWSEEPFFWSWTSGDWVVLKSLPSQEHPGVPAQEEFLGPFLVLAAQDPSKMIHLRGQKFTKADDYELHLNYFLTSNSDQDPVLEVYQMWGQNRSQFLAQGIATGRWEHLDVELNRPMGSEVWILTRKNSNDSDVVLGAVSIKDVDLERSEVKSVEEDEKVPGHPEPYENGDFSARKSSKYNHFSPDSPHDESNATTVSAAEKYTNNATYKNAVIEATESRDNYAINETTNSTVTDASGGPDSSNLTADNATVPGGLDSSNLTVNNVTVPGGLGSSNLTADNVTVPGGLDSSNLTTDNVTVPGDLDSSNFTADNVTVQGGLDSSNLTVDNVTVPGGLDSSNLTADNVTVPGDLDSSNITADNVTVPSSLDFSNLTAGNVTAPSGSDSFNITMNNVTAIPPANPGPMNTTIGVPYPVSTNASNATSINSTSDYSSNTASITTSGIGGVNGGLGGGDDEGDVASTGTAFHLLVGLVGMGMALLAFLYWRNKKKRAEDEVAIYSRNPYSEYANPTFEDEDTSSLSSRNRHNYKTIE